MDKVLVEIRNDLEYYNHIDFMKSDTKECIGIYKDKDVYRVNNFTSSSDIAEGEIITDLDNTIKSILSKDYEPILKLHTTVKLGGASKAAKKMAKIDIKTVMMKRCQNFEKLDVNDQLMCAVNAKDYEMTKALLKAGADPNHLSIEKGVILFSPLSRATMFLDKKLVEILLKAGADPNVIASPFGSSIINSLVYGAVKYESSKVDLKKRLIIAELLLAKGANPYIRDKNDKNAIFYGKVLEKYKNNSEFVKLLQKYGKKLLAKAEKEQKLNDKTRSKIAISSEVKDKKEKDKREKDKKETKKDKKDKKETKKKKKTK